MIEFFIDFNLVGNNNQCKAVLITEFMRHEKTDRPSPPYKVTIQSYQYQSIEAYYKIIFESLELAGVIESKELILKIGETSQKFLIPIGERENHYIRIENYNDGE